MEAPPDAPAPTYFEIMAAACETMAIEILGFPDGHRRYPGGVVDALAFPPGLQNQPLDVDALAFPPGLQNQPLDALLPWALRKQFGERCEALSLPATCGHEQWLKRNSDLCIVHHWTFCYPSLLRKRKL